MTLKIFSLGIFAFFLAACSTSPKKAVSGPIDKARWETKMRVKDLSRNKSQSLSVDVLGEKTGPLRLEATAIMGYPVASYVMDQQGFRCAVYPQKQFYEGPLTENALRPLVKIALSPQILRHIAFDEPIRGTDWVCQAGEDRLVSECRSARRGLTIAWNRHESGKTVKVRGAEFEMDWAFDHPQTEVQFKDGTFRLETPSGFKVIRL
ncbi:MAG: hypothetical protein KF802_08355 [Bdellovibrionaceae bacterium]|nr:hypothetical protein [Pseudobdellovibrionaceae bacterium]MBX3034944.1 hypothetical protein [Pseudobdellovibrionaceae bacterium]